MTSTMRRVCALATLIVCGSIVTSGGDILAANGPNKLLPTPSAEKTFQSAPAEKKAAPAAEPVPTPAANEPEMAVENGGAVYEEEDCGECGDFAGLCSPPGRFWLRGEYLMWWTNGQSLPPLVTTSPQRTPVSEAGVLPNATVLYGLSTVNDDGHSGARGVLGFWIDSCHLWGMEFDYFNFGEHDNSFAQSSTGNPILARPFFNVQTGASDAELVAYPGVAEGTVTAEARDYFHSAGITLSRSLGCCNVCGDCDQCGECNDCGDSSYPGWCPGMFGTRTDLLLGFRYFGLSDRVSVHETLRSIGDTPTNGTIFDIRDSFSSRNDFYGADVGLRTKIFRGRFSLDLLTKVAIGNNHETVVINGQTMITAPLQPTQTYGAGILAGPSNTGTFQRDVFTMIPQLGLELGFQVNCHWRAFVGYNVLYWGCVSRAGDQIDLNVDPRNFPPSTEGGLPFPAFTGRTDCFWAQGVNVGGEFRF